MINFDHIHVHVATSYICNNLLKIERLVCTLSFTYKQFNLTTFKAIIKSAINTLL